MKDQFLAMLSARLSQDAIADLAKGKITSPTKLNDVCARLIPKLRSSLLTKHAIRSWEITDSDLREAFRNALMGAGIEVLIGYARLAPSTLCEAPVCYGSYKGSECRLCLVCVPCEAGTELEYTIYKEDIECQTT